MQRRDVVVVGRFRYELGNRARSEDEAVRASAILELARLVGIHLGSFVMCWDAVIPNRAVVNRCRASNAPESSL